MTINEVFQKICENPEDDELRLEYARQIEPSDPDHAELIRFQIEITADRRRGTRMYGDEARERALLGRHRDRWARDIAKYTAHGQTSQIEFERGFPGLVRMHPETFIEYADLIFRLAPLRHIDFIKPYDEDGELIMDEQGNLAPFPMKRLVACTQLSRLDSIGFPNVEFVPSNPGEPGDVTLLARCPHLTRCVYLNFAFTLVNRHAAIELAEGALTGKMLVVVSPLDLGERRYGDVEVGMGEYIGTTFDEHWKDVEARLGYIPWLHPSHNRVNRFDARWHLERGHVPKYPPGSPQRPEWYDVPRQWVPRSW